MRGTLALRRPLGLRQRYALAFALGGLGLAVIFAGVTYVLTREFLLEQRQRAVLRQSYLDVSLMRARLVTAGTSPAEALSAVSSQGATAVLLHLDGEWFSSSLDLDAGVVPARLQRVVAQGSVGVVPSRVLGEPSLVVGVPLAGFDAQVYEVRSEADVAATLDTLRLVLSVGAAVAVALAAAVGARTSRQLVRPLDPLAGTAAAIASGELSRRLPDTSDPDLAIIVASFNSMADAVQQRIERDARFASDVSHELRSPLTTLVGCVDLLAARRAELSPTACRALDLVAAEVQRLQRLLEDLISMARADPAAVRESARDLDLAGLVRQELRERRMQEGLLRAPEPPYLVHADPRALQRVVANLLDNADRHGGGATAVSLDRDDGGIRLAVEDAGPGVPSDQRDRVFERFATLGGPRGSSSGSGLGLALVREIAQAHGGSAWCARPPAGGALFVLRLPLASE